MCLCVVQLEIPNLEDDPQAALAADPQAALAADPLADVSVARALIVQLPCLRPCCSRSKCVFVQFDSLDLQALMDGTVFDGTVFEFDGDAVLDLNDVSFVTRASIAHNCPCHPG